jgi:hypothetical protein
MVVPGKDRANRRSFAARGMRGLRAVLAKIIGFGVVPWCARLRLVVKTAASRITIHAHRINQGAMPEILCGGYQQ